MNDTIVNKDFHGIIAMLNERNDQIHKHGYTVKNDVLHNPNGELIVAARALMKEVCVPHDFPEHWGIAFVRKLVLKSYTERLVIAGALLAAEVDRRMYIRDIMHPKNFKKEFKNPLTTDQAFKIKDELIRK